MRDYSKVAPTFWTGETGKELRRRGIEAVLVAAYLMTSPHSNMLGLYYQPVLYMAHETGLGIEGASKGLQHCIDAGFCRFDEASDMVWVVEMAKWQIAESLKATDKRCAGIQKDYDALPANPFLGLFFDRYEGAFHLKRRRSSEGGKQESTQAPSKPHRSQEQEQEQEQEQDPPSGERREGASQRATRKCPSGFALTPELRDWATREVRGVDLERETARFRDHTFSRSISDWPGAWRNWMRKALDDVQNRGMPRGSRSQPVNIEARNAEARRLLGFGTTQETIDA